MLKKISILFLFLFFVLNNVFAYSDDVLDKMEYIKYGTVFNQEALASRLNRLETDYFGMRQSGDLDSRIENLSKIVKAGNYGNIQPYNAYVPSKKNLFQKVLNDLSGFMSMPYMTGFSPSILDEDAPYNNDLYDREYMKMRNNYYCPADGVYDRNHYQKFRNYNKYGNNRNNLNSYNPFMNRNPYRYIPSYNPYIPTDSYKNVSTGSTVHILND